MEQYPLLATKLFIPSIRSELVHRPDLIKKLSIGLGQSDFQKSLSFAHKITLISAPAGFGKTTLVSEWVHTLDEASSPIAVSWLSLDESDNDLTRFLTYFITALEQIEGINTSFGKGALSMLQSPQLPPTDTILTSLINEIAAVNTRIILVLDDYHLIDAQPIHDALIFLLHHLPAQMHLVIATRTDPPLPLARLRARGQLTELRAADLRFSSEESTSFLNQMMHLHLSVEDIVALETRTEGWIAGLQMAALSMQERTNITGFIQSFSGSHRYVLDYLIEEVLEQQPGSIQTFLLHTAILDQLNGSLCDAIRFGSAETTTVQEDGQAILEMLEHANLFIIPLDDERHWYRYHHLFADLLRQRLRQTQPELVLTLHTRASKWYELNAFNDEAIEHAFRAQDFERAVFLINEYVDTLWQLGKHGKLRRWLEVLPDECILSKPQLCIPRAYYLLSSGQYQEGEYLLQEVEKVLGYSNEIPAEDQLERKPLYESERIRLLAKVAVTRAMIDSYNGDVAGMIQHANRALELLPEQDLTWRSLAAFSLGDAHSFLGDMAASFQARSEAVRVCEAAGDVYYGITAHLKLTSTLREQGKLQQTLETCQQQTQRAKAYGIFRAGPVGCLLSLYGEVLAELNDLDEALHQAKMGVEIAEGGGNLAILGFSYLYLMRVLLSRGDLPGIEDIIQKVTHLNRKSVVPSWLTNQMGTWQARIWLELDKLDAASQWMEEHELTINGVPTVREHIDFLQLFNYIMFARILIAQSHLGEASRLLQHLADLAEKGGRTTRVIEILILQALTMQARNNPDLAITALDQALTLAKPGGFIRIFVDEGPPMARLLYEALNRRIAPGYVRRLLAAFPVDQSTQTTLSQIQTQKSDLFEPLSERELEVLQLIAQGLTNQEIATRLFLSQNTVKAHTRNIYGKVDAHSRTQAVARAKALGVLPST